MEVNLTTLKDRFSDLRTMRIDGSIKIDDSAYLFIGTVIFCWGSAADRAIQQVLSYLSTIRPE